ncbi:MAG: hypothetical protein HYX32_04575 [Actinobacteria bacterium]|nr:hypothetical protein [Actinomycetota bacterium]
MPAGHPRLLRRGAIVRLALVTLGLVATSLAATPSPATAEPPPNPLLWQRKLVTEYPQTDDEVRGEIIAECANDLERGVRENSSPGPRIAALGDSVQSQMRGAAMADPAIHWMYASHCGEKLGTAIDSGRVADVVASNPAATVIGLGGNDLSEFWQVRPENLPAALYNLQRLLDASDQLPCRVIYTLPEVAPFFANGDEAVWLDMTRQINNAIRAAAQTRAGLLVADWAQTVSWFWPAYLQDGMHLTRFGINEKTNLAVATARQCWAPDTPANVGAVAGNGTATVWWDPLPPQEKALFYTVTAPDGRTLNTTESTVNFPGLTNGVPYQFRVKAVSFAGVSTQSSPTASVTPSGAGARFNAMAPVRVLDTRDGTGGKGSAFGPGESFRLSLAGAIPAGASAAVLNITAVGQTEPTFVTVWPGGQSRPLSSNLNPRPGINAVPAMATTRVAPDRSIGLYNNSGSVGLIVDVVGYYGAPGDATGSLYAPLQPVRVLDTRDTTGGHPGPFGGAEQFALSLPQLPSDAAAAVLNVTSTGATGDTHVTVWPDGVPRPLASSLNPQPGLTRANLTVSKVGTGNRVLLYNNSASTDLIVDLVGYYTAPGVLAGGAEYFPITPERTYDTRNGSGGIAGPIGNGSNLQLGFTGKGAIPAGGVSAIDANLTVTDPSGFGHTTAWPSGTKPDASNLNYLPGEIVANRDNITLSPGGTALLWSAATTVNYIVDTAGWFGSPL